MKILNATLVVGGLFCVGCGGGSGNGTKDSAAAVVSGTIGPNTVGASYTGSEFFFTAEGTDITMARQGSHDAGAFEHYHAETPESRAYGAQSANSLVAVVASDSSTLVPYAGTNFQNLASTTIPDGGSIRFRGDYAAFLRNEPNSSISRLINGRVAITANFTNDRVDGTITDREARLTATNALDNTLSLSDVTLNLGPIDGLGAFSGTTTGGEINGPGWADGAGTYSGLITGPLANEIVGGVVIDHLSPANVQFKEVGGFIAD